MYITIYSYISEPLMPLSVFLLTLCEPWHFDLCTNQRLSYMLDDVLWLLKLFDKSYLVNIFIYTRKTTSLHISDCLFIMSLPGFFWLFVWHHTCYALVVLRPPEEEPESAVPPAPAQRASRKRPQQAARRNDSFFRGTCQALVTTQPLMLSE